MSASGDQPAVSSLGHSRAPKYNEIALLLEQQIRSGDIAGGSRLPTLKALAEQFSVSEQTAFRAVRVIADKGLVSTAHRRSGAVVLGEHAAIRPRNALLACLFRPVRARNEMDNFALDMVEGIQEEISRQGYRYIHHGLNEVDYSSRMMEIAQSGQVCGLILDQKTPLSLVRRLVATGLPTVMFNRHEDLPGLSTVTPDMESIARETVAFCRERGYERLGFYSIPADEATWDESRIGGAWGHLTLRSAFVAAASEAGFGSEDILLIPDPLDRSLGEEPETFLLPRRKDARWRRTAILASRDVQALAIIKAVRKTDLRLREDIGVIGCYDLESDRRAPVPPTTWRVDPHAVGATAARELLSRVERASQTSSVIRISATFVDRETA